MSAYDGDLTVVTGEGEVMVDWWVLEKVGVERRSWLERTEYGAALCISTRLGNADVEGTSAEMLALAAAIRSGGMASFTRCAVKTTPDGVEVHSPRNSLDEPLVTKRAAETLASAIETKCRGHEQLMTP